MVTLTQEDYNKLLRTVRHSAELTLALKEKVDQLQLKVRLLEKKLEKK